MEMEDSLAEITKWWRQSGLKVNNDKTELCLFNRLEVAPVQIRLGVSKIVSKRSMNALTKLVQTNRSFELQDSRSLNVIKIIRRLFRPN
jgi:hypothetical protein